ncbi:MAG: hypothetical protein AAF211_30050 [Myxococcota bacterium]
MRAVCIGLLFSLVGCEPLETEPFDTGVAPEPISQPTPTTPQPVEPGSWATQGFEIDLVEHPTGAFAADVMNDDDILLLPAVLEVDLTSMGCRIVRTSIDVDEAGCPSCTRVELVDEQGQTVVQETSTNGLTVLSHSSGEAQLVRLRVIAGDAVVGPLRLNL